jgi:hypothetical protein
VSDFGQNELLNDVLHEGNAVDLREELLQQTLYLVKRRRRIRTLQQGASLVMVFAGLACLTWYQVLPLRIPAGLPAKPYAMVRTQPLSQAAWVTTQPLTSERLIATVRTDNIMVTAMATSPVGELNDDELLALAPQPAALVRFGPHNAELVFVEQTDHGVPLRN